MVGGREPIEPMRLYTEQQQRHDLNYEPDKVADAPQAAWGRSEAPTVELDSLEEWKGATLASRRVADGLRQNNLVSAAPRYPSTGASVLAGAQADSRPPLHHQEARTRRAGDVQTAMALVPIPTNLGDGITGQSHRSCAPGGRPTKHAFATGYPAISPILSDRVVGRLGRCLAPAGAGAGGRAQHPIQHAAEARPTSRDVSAACVRSCGAPLTQWP